jgi:hypothetical protein
VSVHGQGLANGHLACGQNGVSFGSAALRFEQIAQPELSDGSFVVLGSE